MGGTKKHTRVWLDLASSSCVSLCDQMHSSKKEKMKADQPWEEKERVTELKNMEGNRKTKKGM